MTLAQGRFWRASLGRDAVELEILRASLPEDLHDARELRCAVPLSRWNLLLKNVYSDRKLLGGLLLDFARSKERVSLVVGSDRLLGELRRIVLDATVTLVEQGRLVLSETEPSEED